MKNDEMVNLLREKVDNLEERLSEKDYLEIEHKRGTTHTPKSKDGSLNIEPNGTETIIVRINGGAREVTKNSAGGIIEDEKV